jgi:hypothetical protein
VESRCPDVKLKENLFTIINWLVSRSVMVVPFWFNNRRRQ